MFRFAIILCPSYTELMKMLLRTAVPVGSPEVIQAVSVNIIMPISYGM
jgi:hypothetical protein